MHIDEELIKADYWRAVMYSSLKEQLAGLGLSGSGVEFGGSNGIIQSYCPGVSWETRGYPPFNVLDSSSWDKEWDVVVLDQILEHVERPWEVFDHIGRTCKTAIITVPFLIGVHPCPTDYWRMTPQAIEMLASPHFSKIDTRSWGNTEVNFLHSEYDITGVMMANTEERVWREGLESNDEYKPFVIWAVLSK